LKYMIVNFLLALLPPTRFFELKRFLLNLFGVGVGARSRVCGGVKFYGAGRVVIGEDCWIGLGSRFYVSEGVNVTIHDRCDIAPEVAFMTGTHELGDASRRAGVGKSASIEVGPGTWIGFRSTLLAGCRIGGSCIVGANTLLLGRIYPASTLVLGSPACIAKSLPGDENAAE